MRASKNTTSSSRAGPREWLLLAASLVVLFLVCEIAVRSFLADGELGWSNQLGWTMVPPVELRVRDTADKLPGQLRVLVLGDSQTEWRDTTGHSYVRVAERKLAESGVSVQMINLAEAGADFVNYLGNLLAYADKLKPDLVLVGLYAGNDLFAETPPLNTPEGRAAAIGSVTQNADVHSILVRWVKKSEFLSYVFLIGKRYLRNPKAASLEKLASALSNPQRGGATFVNRRFKEIDPAVLEAVRAGAINRALLYQAVYWPDYYGDLAAADPDSATFLDVRGALSDLAVLVKVCREKNMPVAVVLIPPAVWVSESYLDFYHRLGFGKLGPVSGPVPVVEYLKGELAGLAVPVVDVLPALRAAPQTIYIANDEHLNRQGHAIVGAELARALVSSGLLKSFAGTHNAE